MGLPVDPDEEHGSQQGPHALRASLASEIQREDLERQVQTLERKRQRHALWAVLGVSPAAFLPALGLIAEGNIGLLILLSFLVTGTQAFSWARASRESKKLKEQLSRFEAED